MSQLPPILNRPPQWPKYSFYYFGLGVYFLLIASSLVGLSRLAVIRLYAPKANIDNSILGFKLPNIGFSPDVNMLVDSCKSRFGYNQPNYPNYQLNYQSEKNINPNLESNSDSSTPKPSQKSGFNSSQSTSSNNSNSSSITNNSSFLPAVNPNNYPPIIDKSFKEESQLKLKECLNNIDKQQQESKETIFWTELVNNSSILAWCIILLPFHLLIFRPRK